MSNINVNNITPLAGTSGTVSVSGSLFVSGSITAEGNITLGDSTSDSVSFGAEVSSSIIPDANATYNLGSNAKKWKDLYLAGAITTVSGTFSYLTGSSPITIAASMIPDLDDTHDLGSFHQQWRNLYIDGVANIDIIGNVASSSITVSSSLKPYHSNYHDLGTYSNKWKGFHCSGARMDTSYSGYLQMGRLDSHVYPRTTNTLTIGAQTHKILQLHLRHSSFSSSGSVSQIKLEDLPTTAQAAAIMGTGSLFLSGSRNANGGRGSKALHVFVG